MLKRFSRFQPRASKTRFQHWSSRGSRALSTQSGWVDVHTHMYFPRYMDIMRKRDIVPKIVIHKGEDRLVILPGEDAEESTAKGRPIGPEYFDYGRKLEFMDIHGIERSVLSLANPWLDFLDSESAADVARALNQDLEVTAQTSQGRFLGFGVLPFQNLEKALEEVEYCANELPHIKGFIIGTHGAGKGLDDSEMLPLLKQCEKHGAILFVHPHYGVGNEYYTGFGHALFLACGFTFETTVSISRLICSGMLDKVPQLKLLLAHSGGTLPFLAGRLDSCVAHEPELRDKLECEPSAYLKRFYYDAVCYSTKSLECLEGLVGRDRILFGTDHPFFPPPTGGKYWISAQKNQQVIDEAGFAAEITSANAERILGFNKTG